MMGFVIGALLGIHVILSCICINLLYHKAKKEHIKYIDFFWYCVIVSITPMANVIALMIYFDPSISKFLDKKM